MRRYALLPLLLVAFMSTNLWATKVPTPAGSNLAKNKLTQLVLNTSRLPLDAGKWLTGDGWWKAVKRVAITYVVAAHVALPLCTDLVCGSRDAAMIADRLVQQRISPAEVENLVVYTDAAGQQRFGLSRSYDWLGRGNDSQYISVVPYTVYRDLPFVSLDGFFKADGAWGALNSDFIPDRWRARRVHRAEVIDLKPVGELRSRVVIEDADGNTMSGRGVVLV